MSSGSKSFSLYYYTIIFGIAASSIYYSTQYHEKSPIVRVSTGDVQGLVATSRNGRKFNLFLGIPFAEPPVGKLRFESPEPVKSWNGTLDATKHGPECKGFDFFFLGRPQGEESCLFLNVYSPKNVTKLHPVIVHIHGGGFHMGSTQRFDGKFFMDHDVVLVTIQYRLGIFGFLHTSDGTIKGNMGLKDQVLALKWVQKNIVNFGGDPDQVTIMGESAGGSSVHLLMLSPMAKGLFHRAVTMGLVATSGLMQFDHDKSGLKDVVAEYFSCPKGSQEFLKCMRDIDEHALASFHSQFMTAHVYNNSAYFCPTIEMMDGPDAFLTENPSMLLEKGQIVNKVPWIVGANKNEGLLLLGMLLRFMNVHQIIDEKNWDNALPNLIVFDKNQRPDVVMKVRNHVFKDANLSKLGEVEGTNKISAMVSESLFLKPLVESARVHAKAAPVYVYFYTYSGFFTTFDFYRWSSPDSILPAELIVGLKIVKELFYKYVLRLPQTRFAASHGDDLFLLYPVINELPINYFDLEMSEILVQTYVDFATLEKPSFQGLEWPALNSSEKLQVMELNSGKPKILQDPFDARIAFWKELNLSHA